MTPEIKVKKYLENMNQEPLYFFSRHSTGPRVIERNFKGQSLESVVLEVIGLTQVFPSRYKNKDLVCGAGAWRSSGDIWKHVKVWRPRTSLMRVMRIIFEEQEHLRGQYCPGIKKRTFKLKINSNYMGNDYHMHRKSFEDEYGLTWWDWENIGLKKSAKKDEKVLPAKKLYSFGERMSIEYWDVVER